MESSSLQSLLLDTLGPLEQNPNLLLMRVLGEKMFYKLYGLLNSPLLKSVLPVQINPEEFIVVLVGKLRDLPPEFWEDIEDTLRGVLDGDAAAYDKAKNFLGVVVNGN